MKLRSMLFVPADSERKLAKSIGSPADVLILDLEDSVAESRKVGARSTAAEFIAAHSASLNARLFVRINPLDSALAMGDLATVVVPGLAGIMLPKTNGAGDIVRLGYCLDALEARAGLLPGTVKVVPVATETAQAMLNMQSFAGPIDKLARLAGVTWGAEDLSSAIGAVSNREGDGPASGDWSPLYLLARRQMKSGDERAWIIFRHQQNSPNVVIRRHRRIHLDDNRHRMPVVGKAGGIDMHAAFANLCAIAGGLDALQKIIRRAREPNA